MRRPQKFEKIPCRFLQNGFFYSVAPKQVGDFFKFCGFFRKLDFTRKYSKYTADLSHGILGFLNLVHHSN